MTTRNFRKIVFGAVLCSALLVSLGCAPKPSTAPAPAPAPATTPAPAPAPAPKPAATEAIELKITTHLGPTHLITRSIRETYPQLEQMSGGRLKIKIYDSETLAKSTEAFDSTVGGVADIAQINPSYWPGRFPTCEVGILPGMFPNSSVGTFAMNQLFDTFPYLTQQEFKDVKVLGYYNSAPNVLIFKDKKITSIDQMKGLRLRATGDAEAMVVKQFGAEPVVMGSADVYASLQRGLVDGCPYTIASIPAYRFYEVTRYLVDANTGISGMMHIMNLKTWNKLSPDLQAMVAYAGKEAVMRTAMRYDQEAVLARAYLAQKGMEIYTFSAAEQTKFDAALKPVNDNWVANLKAKGLPAQDVYDKAITIRNSITQLWK